MRTVVLACLALFVITSVGSAQPSGAWADKLFSNELTHDFGVVPRGAQLKHSFKITNIYKVPLEITDVRVSCGCLKAEPNTKVIQPNETAMLNITMDGRQFNGLKIIRIAVTVGPKYISTATLTVSANARGDAAFNPKEIDFGNHQRGNAATRPIDIEYTGSMSDWRVVEIVKNSSAPFELKVEELPRLVNSAARRGYRIHATMKSDAPPGAFKQEVILKTNDPTSPMLTFQVVGNVQAGLTVAPNPIALGRMKVSESQTKKVFVRAARPFRITAVDGQGDGIKVETPNREDTTQVLTVTIDAAKAGAMRRTLMIRTDLDSEQTPLVIEGAIEP
jgi:hypothetical protein